MPDPRLQAAIRQEMQQRPPMDSKPPSKKPIDDLTPASDEDEAYVDRVYDHVARRMYAEGATERVVRMIEKAPQEMKLDAIILASMPFMEVAYEALQQMPTEPPEEVGDQLMLQIVDGVLEIAEESGAQSYSDELGEAALVGVRQKWMEMHSELYGGGNQHGQLQSQPGPSGPSGRGGGLRQV